MNVQLYVTQRLRSTIWYCIDNDMLETAEFTAERLVGVTSKGDLDSIYLYALVLYRREKYKTAYRLTANHVHIGCAFIFAKCALRLELQTEGIYALQQTMHLWNKSPGDIDDDEAVDDGDNSSSGINGAFKKGNQANNNINYEITRRSIPDSAALFSLLAKLYASTGDVKESSMYHAQALKMNPYLWDSFEQLCQMGVSVNTKSIYNLKPTLSDHLGYGASTMPSKLKSSSTGLAPMNPKSFFSKPNSFGQEDTSFNNNISDGNNNISNQYSGYMGGNQQNGNNSFSADNNNPNNANSAINANNIFSTPRLKHTSLPDAPLRRPVRNNEIGAGGEITDSIQRSGTRFTASKVTSRLINQSTPSSSGNSNSIFNYGKRDLKRGKSLSKHQSNTILGGSNNSLDLRKKEYNDQAELQLMTLYSIFARGLKAMSRYDCYKAIRIFNQLPDSQIETPWVLGKLGRLNFEIVNYSQAEQYFIRLRNIDRTRVEDMEYYSTLLWHLHKDVELSFLAHELYEINKNCPQTWVTIGNLFSLQRETDDAIKCFQRAIQVDHKFAYGYTLQGHEYIANDAYENALESFRNALLFDSKHYNALYGIGMVYLKLGDFAKAEYHFRKARDINPVNVILICCVGMVLEKLDKKQLALKQYELATELQPLSPLALFKKAQLLFALQHIQAALAEFEKLKVIAPDEASVHFLLGQLYKITHRKTDSIKEFTIALNLDPKGSHLIREALESLSED